MESDKVEVEGEADDAGCDTSFDGDEGGVADPGNGAVGLVGFGLGFGAAPLFGFSIGLGNSGGA